MDNQQIHEQISELVDREHALRADSSEATAAERRTELRHIEEQLDQCWDLLRQRRARREQGENPDQAHVRPVSEVEGYRQ